MRTEFLISHSNMQRLRQRIASYGCFELFRVVAEMIALWEVGNRWSFPLCSTKQWGGGANWGLQGLIRRRLGKIDTLLIKNGHWNGPNG